MGQIYVFCCLLLKMVFNQHLIIVLTTELPSEVSLKVSSSTIFLEICTADQ